jgi:DNA-directed RNA polymerase specialized sigma24 family protein
VPRTFDHSGDARSLSALGLSRLLARLDPDGDRAAQEYERLRRALVRFFDWRGAWDPEECADDTIDRLARKLAEDTTVDDLHSYARGIARLVLLERRRTPAPASIDHDPAFANWPSASGGGSEREHACLERCLAELPDEGRALVLDYYTGERDVKIANRRRLAASLDVSENALRSRVQRLRDRLESCMRGCLAAQDQTL